MTNNFLEEDDLGFDPFHETQKALAEMLESESKAAETVRPKVCNMTLGVEEWQGTVIGYGCCIYSCLHVVLQGVSKKPGHFWEP